MMLTCSGGRSSPSLSRSLFPPHSSPVLGLNATPTVFRRPRAKIRPPEPSGLNCETAARSESRSSHRLHDDPTARYSLYSKLYFWTISRSASGQRELVFQKYNFE